MNELMEINKMPDIDSLSIRLTSSSTDAVKAINSVIDSLARLNGALNNYTDDSKFVKGMGSLTGGLKGIASSINSIDLEKMKSLATTLDKLGGAGTKISQLNFAKPFADMGSNLQKVNSAASQTALKISDIYMMPKKYKSSIDEYVKTLYNSSGKPSQFREAEEDLKRLVSKAQSSKREFSDLYNKVNGYLSSHKTYIPESVQQDWGDSFGAKRGVLGIKNTTTQIGSGDSIEHVVRQLNELYGAGLKADGSITEMADSLVEFLEEERKAATQVVDFEELDNIIKSISAGFQQATASVNTFNVAMDKNADEEFLEDHGSSNFIDIQNEAAQAAVSVTNLDAAVETLKSQMTMEIANPFEGLITGLEALKEVDLPAEKFAGISQLANSIGKFGGKNSDKAVTNIPRFTKAFAEMASQLASAPQISDNLVRLAEAMSKFSTKTQTATKSTTKFSGASKILNHAFSGMYPHTMRAHRGFTSLAAVFGRLYANFFLVIRAARALGKAIDYSSSMTEAQNVVAVTFGRNSEVMDKFAESAIKDFGMAKLSATQFASRFQAMGSTMGITADKVAKANDFIKEKVSGNSRAYEDLGDSVADMSINLTKLTADMASLYNQDYEDVAQDMQAIYTGMTRPLRKYGLDLTQATLKEWALANGLDADIDKMSQAEKTMLRYQYVMSRAGGAMGDFTKTADTWANAMRTVKQLLQEIARLIGEAFINALRPALLQFRNFLFNFLELTQNALNALGKLLGWKQINFASATLVDDTEDYADALDDAAGAAKKLKGQLRGIDELNNLTTNDKNGGSGSGLSGLAASIDDLINDAEEGEIPYESAIKNWYEFGQKIANAIKNGLTDIDWDSIKEKGRNFATNLASWLNGLIQPDMFFQIGSTIGNAVMTAIETIGEFAKDADWEKWGASIAAGINGFFDKFEGDKAADTINALADGLRKMFTEALNRIHWDEVFNDIKDFATGININTIDFIFTASAIAMVAPAVAGLIASAAMANPVVIPALALSITGGYLVGKGLDKIFENALGKNKVTGNSRYSEMWEDSLFTQADDFFHLKEIAKGEREAKNFSNKLFFAQGQYVKDRKSGLSRKEAYQKYIEDTGLNKDNGKTFWQNPSEYLVRWGYGTSEDIKRNFAPIWEELQAEFEEWSSGIFDDLEVDDAVRWAQDVKDRLLEGFSLDEILLEKSLENVPTAIQNKVTEAIDWLNEKGDEIATNVNTFMTDKIVTPIENAFDSISEYLTTWWNDSIAPWFTKEKWNELLQTVREQFKFAFQAGANFAVGALNKVLEGLEKMMNGAGDLFNALIDLASKILQKDLEKWGRISLPRIATPYANGGYPQVGSLFLAGEAGSEMVGTINGKTGVVSNGEITGIADAIRSTSDTEIQLLRQQNTLLQGILNKEFGISSDSIFNSVRSSARDFTNRTGDPAFA